MKDCLATPIPRLFGSKLERLARGLAGEPLTLADDRPRWVEAVKAWLPG